MRLATARRVWQRWQACAGPWRGWAVCPALLAPEVEEIVPRRVERPAAHEVAAQLASSLRDGGVLLLLDLEPILGVHVAALLSQWKVANGVLLLPRWPYRHAILAVDDLIGALAGQAGLLADDMALPNVAFVLDGERTRAVTARPARDQRADNRSRLSPADLPNLAALRARGVYSVRKVSRA